MLKPDAVGASIIATTAQIFIEGVMAGPINELQYKVKEPLKPSFTA
jgi:hypothetical protein